MAEYRIPLSNVSRFEEHFKQFLKLSNRLGIEPPTCTFVRDEQEAKEEYLDDGTLHKWIAEWKVFEVSGDSPKLAGWTFKSKIERGGDGDEIRSVPGFNLPEEFKSRDICDHCKARRQRNRYFFVQHEDGGDLQQVGSSCVRDFLGHSNPEVVASWFEFAMGFGSYTEDEDGNQLSHGPRPVFLFFYEEALAVTINYVKEHGFLSRRKAKEQSDADYTHVASTSDKIGDILWHNHSLKGKHYEVTEEDKARIAEFTEFFMAKKDSVGSDFVTNVQNTMTAGIGIRPRKMGVIAAAVNMWHRETTEVKEFVPSVYYPGQPKDKLKGIKVSFVRHFAFEGAYGTTNLYTFRDEENHEFVWSTANRFDFEKDEQVLLSGTIKGFKLWTDRNNRDHKQTNVTRCKIEDIAQ